MQGETVKVVRDFSRLRSAVKSARQKGQTVGFVPTMGFLHQGHLSLLEAARRECDYVVMSIFVNPIQFGEGEDYEEYPRDLEQDRELARQKGCDLIFYPRVKAMYPPGYSTFVNVEGEITAKLCGASRPGHFRGVATVVAKLFNLVQPHRAYFGQKDAQQALVIQKMARELNMDLEVVVCPTVREADGLALSSRNSYLSRREREAAPVLYRSLLSARELIEAGEKSAAAVKRHLGESLRSEPLVAEIDYAEVVKAEDLADIEEIYCPVLLAAAIKIGDTRLIDNLMVEV